ncbi:MAG TPA: CdaR family protein [Candidatus Dormibacteraeota bacterium]|nr:CdaR family protein [Candidatus Dormibacteraeota bacterium]
MSWIFGNWQLKLLALVLSLGLFAAVAFQENPVVTVQVKASIEYDGLPGDKILVHSPTTFPVVLTGLADELHAIPASNVTVVVDASKVKNGVVTATGHPKVVGGGSSVRPLDDTIPIQVTVDDRVTVSVPIDTRITYAEGWTAVPGKIAVTPAALGITGAAGELKDLQAFVAPAEPIAASTADIPSLAIQFVRNGRPATLPNDTDPLTHVDDSSLIASLHVEATRPTQTSQVPVVETPTGNVAPGYRITAIDLNPLFVIIAGSAGDLAGLNSLALPAIAVDGATSSITRPVRLTLPPNITSTVTSVTVTITIQKNPVVQPSPTPTPSP